MGKNCLNTFSPTISMPTYQEMTAQQLAKQIVEEADITREEFNEKYREVQNSEYNKLLQSKKALVQFVAEKYYGLILGEDYGPQPSQETSLDIANIVPGLKDLEVEGKVKSISNVKEFGENSVQNITVYDDTGECQIALWNEDLEVVEDIENMDILRIENGYTKESPNEYHENRFGVPAPQIGKYGRLVVDKKGSGEKIVLIDRAD